jgi:hypothetical protein
MVKTQDRSAMVVRAEGEMLRQFEGPERRGLCPLKRRRS